MSNDIVSLELSILKLIHRFIDRQRIILDIFSALRPDLIDLQNTYDDEKKQLEVLNRYINEPWQGHWQGWTYAFHGIGCRLINESTAEIIEWEATDIHTFDRYWFVNWLEWLWMFTPDDSDLELLKYYYRQNPSRYALYEVIFPMLHVLQAEGFIKQQPRHHNRYQLLKTNTSVEQVS